MAFTVCVFRIVSLVLAPVAERSQRFMVTAAASKTREVRVFKSCLPDLQ